MINIPQREIICDECKIQYPILYTKISLVNNYGVMRIKYLCCDCTDKNISGEYSRITAVTMHDLINIIEQINKSL